jgi:hypothetical protein
MAFREANLKLYETIANKAIVAGRTKGTSVIEAQPKTQGGLARGRR